VKIIRSKTTFPENKAPSTSTKTFSSILRWAESHWAWPRFWTFWRLYLGNGASVTTFFPRTLL